MEEIKSKKWRRRTRLNHDDVASVFASLIAPMIVLSDMQTVREVLFKMAESSELWEQMQDYIELIHSDCVIDENGIIRPVKARNKEDLQ